MLKDAEVLLDVGEWKLEVEVVLEDCEHVEFEFHGFFVQLVFHLVEILADHELHFLRLLITGGRSILNQWSFLMHVLLII